MALVGHMFAIQGANQPVLMPISLANAMRQFFFSFSSFTNMNLYTFSLQQQCCSLAKVSLVMVPILIALKRQKWG